jgi:outer membrane protein assembly factor BamB
VFGLITYDHSGKEIWRHKTGFPENTFGSAASPILTDGKLILVRDTNTDSQLIPLSAETGEMVWTRDREGFASGWSTPTIRGSDGRDELLIYGVWWLNAYDPRDGSELWSMPGLSDEPIITPALDGGLVFVTSYNMKSNTEVERLPTFEALLAAHDEDWDGLLNREEASKNVSGLSRNDADGEGDHPLRIFFRFLDENGDAQLSADEWPKLVEWLASMKHHNALLALRPKIGESKPAIAWRFERGVPECPSPLAHAGRTWMIKNGGIVTCLRTANGEVLYEGRLGSGGPYYASPIFADGKLFAVSARGVISILKEGDELDVIDQCDLGERVMATPALVGGDNYIRTESSLIAITNSAE